MAPSDGTTPIPTIIHQIWIGPRPRPTLWMHTWETFCAEQGFTYMLWDDVKITALLQNHPSKPLFEKTRFFGMKADLARYEILAQHGGIYVDADIVYLGQHPEHLLNWQGFTVIPEPQNERILSNSLIGCTPQHPFMQYLSNAAHIVAPGREKEFGSEFDDCWKILGPLYFTQMIAPAAPAINILSPQPFYPAYWREDQSHKNVTMLQQEFPNAATFHYGYETSRIPIRHPDGTFTVK